MKKLFFSICSVVFILLVTTISCNKSKEAKENSNIKMLTVGNPIRFGNESSRLAPGGIGELPGGGLCNCNNHGGSYGGQLQWILATCRSNCQRGIGFRCGRQGVLFCQDGTVVYCIWGANCPSAARGTNPERDMEASYELYDNGTMKLTFLKAIPNEEKSLSTGDVFEVEQTDYVRFSSTVSVDNISYQGFDILQGNYRIDYTDGTYGSVVIGIQLKQ